ncbi:MAG: xylose isomerase [Phycisphaerales bacterium]|nr:xylose isomerase [Phycisphaerales bacterium]
MSNDVFQDVPVIPFEGPDSRNPLAFKHYEADAVVAGKPMREHLRFAAAYWHTMRNPLGDPFGVGTAKMPWDDGSDSIDNALRRVDVFFEFLQKIGIEHYCFHDRDVAPELGTQAETSDALDRVIDHLQEHQLASGRHLLWGTACLFAHPRYVHGAATSCSVEVFACAAAQVRHALDATHRLGGSGYVFWGGREGYTSLLNTDMQREREHLARFLHMAVDHKQAIGFEGAFYIEPKPMEPTTHQYDSDAAACLNFLREFDLLDHFMLNIETNHATLAGHGMEHELRVAAGAGRLGSIDANMGHPQLGWDTDQFPMDLADATRVMLVVLEMGGFTTGGLNFDAKRRRESFDPVDLFHAHIGGMDTFARALKSADMILRDGRLSSFLKERYAQWDSELGQRIEAGEVSLLELEAIANEHGEPRLHSGRQEMLESIFNEAL